MSILYGLVTFLAGTILTVQSGINGQLRKKVCGNPVLASFFSFTGGVLVLTLVLAVTSLTGILPFPTPAMLHSTRWWMWTGGFVGAGLVLGSIVLPQKIGFASYFSMLVAGQLVGSVAADAMGLFGSDVHPLNAGRIAGVICLLAGALLVQKKRPPKTTSSEASPKAAEEADPDNSGAAAEPNSSDAGLCRRQEARP